MVSHLTASGIGRASASMERLRGLPAHLATNIKGQDHVIGRVCSVLMRGELGFAHPLRPRGSFLFVGPTGVGKTETTNLFTNYLFDGASPARFDMSEYQLQSSVEKLIGGSRDDRGLLGRALRDVTRGTLLFDEIEKAHPLVLDLFLQILEDARITLATGETLDLRRFYITCTSNIGSAESMRMESAPFASVERTVLMRVREHLRPELVGRVNEIVVFARLGYAIQREICESMIAAELDRLRAMSHKIEIDANVVEFLVREGYHRTLGARPMRGAVERHLQEAIAVSLLCGGSGSGRITTDAVASRLILN
ncbi:MAG: ATP-dependent Clp protease ATP-binding subunit [Planctomycetaceae bacterium]|nr:ATP-dependent Clp protease ATP-binding subunit [Planctomycetaceae bacterium]